MDVTCQSPKMARAAADLSLRAGSWRTRLPVKTCRRSLLPRERSSSGWVLSVQALRTLIPGPSALETPVLAIDFDQVYERLAWEPRPKRLLIPACSAW